MYKGKTYSTSMLLFGLIGLKGIPNVQQLHGPSYRVFSRAKDVSL